MCGIAGFMGRGTGDDLKRMTDALIHRGPDGEGFWTDATKGVYLGHRRLSIIDIAGGTQPMWTRDRRIGVVFNGEIYNHAALRVELERLGHMFSSDHSDTEVLLYGYLQWGTDISTRLNGMWAFALYDKARELIFCSRDRLGKKPFYYTYQNDTFAFASELTALTKHRSLQATVSIAALQKYFGYGYIPSPLSLYKEVSKLPAGCSLQFSLADRTVKLERYWRFVLEPMEERPSGFEERWAEELRHLLNSAVARRLVSDVPLGVFLSGGVDSSAIAACAVIQQKPGAGRLSTFSIGFDENEFDESHYAMTVARHLGTLHHQENFSLEKARALIPEILKKLDEPIADSSLLPTFLLCRHARQRVTVALSGDGADELFAGYAPFQALRWAKLYRHVVPSGVHTAIRALANAMPVRHGYMNLDFKIKRTLRGLSYPKMLWNPMWMSPLDLPEMAQLFEAPVDLNEIFSEAITLWDACKPSKIEDQTLQFFTRLYLENDILTKVDRAGMLNSLEVRSPFLDTDLVDFARKIPSEFKIRQGKTKYLLKRALAPMLPQEILDRPKQGFAVPMAHWFKTGLLTVDTSPSIQGLSQRFVKLLQDKHRAGQANYHDFLWAYQVLKTSNVSSY
jgi:asparagine synthase (glutamine-hydrolysing)